MRPLEAVEHPLELTGAAFRELCDQAVERLTVFLDAQADQPAHGLDAIDERVRAVREPLPTHGQPLRELLDGLFRDVFPVAFNTTGPGYLAYIPGGGLPHAAVADLIALVANRYVGLSAAAPVVSEVEATVVRWLCEIVGYDGSTAGGFLTSGGSLANWAALVVPRDQLAPDDFSQCVVYTSRQAHHSVAKAAALAGFSRRHLRLVEVDQQFRLCPDDLRRQIADDRRAGLRPLVLVGQAGTTNTGAVDDLSALADIAAGENLWLHVDAAYGGFFLMTDRGRAVMRGIERADSITLDPHKGLFLPYGTGCLLVRRGADLRPAFAGRGEYMTATAPDGRVDFCDISPELSRDFRGLRIWLPFKMLGIEPFRQCLDEKLDLAQSAAEALRGMPGIDVVAEPQLSIVAFRLRDRGESVEQNNRRNRALLDRINAHRRVYLSSTTLDGRLTLRLCVLCFRTHQDRMEECLSLIAQESARLLADEVFG